jgi:hypothetical protein
MQQLRSVQDNKQQLLLSRDWSIETLRLKSALIKTGGINHDTTRALRTRNHADRPALVRQSTGHGARCPKQRLVSSNNRKFVSVDPLLARSPVSFFQKQAGAWSPRCGF